MTSPPNSTLPTATPPSDLASSLQGMLPDLSLGAVLGFATGVAVKFVGRLALIVVGLLFIALQLLSLSGIVTIDWLKLESTTAPWFKDGGHAGAAWFMQVLTSRLPFVGAFTAGLLLGLRRR